MKRSPARILAVPAIAAVLVLALSSVATAQTARLDISDRGWVGFTEVNAVKHDGIWYITGTLNKTRKGGCLVLEADNGTLSWGTDQLARICKTGSIRIDSNTNKHRLVLRVPKTWGRDATATKYL
ncbi:hypothetical protein [Streptomyces sp. NPDC054804]